ncbi:MAG: magnesium transporter [Gemmatimonadota bacterium]|nr:MAG: magnesium transporter [Gemmatimonadota bacterium]
MRGQTLQTEIFTAEQLSDAWPILSVEERSEGFQLLEAAEADEFFLLLSAADQALLVAGLPPTDARRFIRLLAPDDAADVIQSVPQGERTALLAMLDTPTRHEVTALLAYAEDEAGGLMNPRFARLRPDMRVDEAIRYLRKQAGNVEAIHYVYVLEADQRLAGVISFRELFQYPDDSLIRDVMHTDVISVPPDMDQEALARLYVEKDLFAIPVVDVEGRIQGIVTFDDIADVVREEATEDIQKVGGSAVLPGPYLEVGATDMILKRAGWLSILFLGELLTASAMGYFEDEIARAVVLTLFLPLIISSGGNSGSQATTLVIRAMAISEVRLQDWWRVLRRELLTGLGLGSILAVLGLLRVLAGGALGDSYGEHYFVLAITVALSLVGVVLWGTLMGSMLPFVMRRLGFDPASASAPFVATLVDVTGLIIYFGLASFLLRGTLL